MRNFIKHASRKPGVRRGLTWLSAQHIRAVQATTRWRMVNAAVAEAAWAGKQPAIFAFWHNRLTLMAHCWRSTLPFHMLISGHPDGQMIANAVAGFGITAVAGSSTRGGGEALRTLVRKLKQGESVGITPDGPRGPRMRAGDGAIALARLTGAPIIPVAVSVNRRIVLKTWDRLIIGLPFGRGVVVFGAPITVPRDGDDTETLRAALEHELNHVSRMADEMTGHEAISPADVSAHASA